MGQNKHYWMNDLKPVSKPLYYSFLISKDWESLAIRESIRVKEKNIGFELEKHEFETQFHNLTIL